MMERELIEVKEVQRELIETLKALAAQVAPLSFLLYALLDVTDQKALQRIKEILEAQAASGEFEGGNVVALRDALLMVSEFCNSGDHPADPRKFFRLIPGGKDEHNSPAEKS